MEESAGGRLPPVVAIAGPTAVGKSRLALELAERLGASILSADSKQVYRYMDVGTAKPSPLERAATSHSMIDLVEPSDTYSAQRFAAEGRRVLRAEAVRGRVVLVVGGTGFYMSALLDGRSLPEVEPNEDLRAHLRGEIERLGPETVHRRLAEIDPESAARVHPNNLPRLVRALEIVETLGRPVPARSQAAAVPALFLGLTMERPALYEVADLRIDRQMRDGLVEEVEALLAMGYDPSLPALQGLGYRDMIRLLRGELTRDEAVASYRVATRQYVRRQMTWFRADRRIEWLDAGENALERARARVELYLSTASSRS